MPTWWKRGSSPMCRTASSLEGGRIGRTSIQEESQNMPPLLKAFGYKRSERRYPDVPLGAGDAHRH